jgi:hypothetical protein
MLAEKLRSCPAEREIFLADWAFGIKLRHICALKAIIGAARYNSTSQAAKALPYSYYPLVFSKL